MPLLSCSETDTRPREGGEKQPKTFLYQLFLSNFWMESTRKLETSRITRENSDIKHLS